MKVNFKLAIGSVLLSSFLVGCGATTDIEDDEICSNPKIIQKLVIDNMRADLAAQVKPEDAIVRVAPSKNISYLAKEKDIDIDSVKLCYFDFKKINFKDNFKLYEKDGKLVGIVGFGVEVPLDL
ncbi:hypothetical protein [Campylobacter sp. US33a]|uniref:hypothetical protein n=1 Tax=Campylobacter sp. US33a TaxID=2498120 RepID=UPI001067CB3B|nr:hypothetical protein [Campylobacter sp. US33a]TEY00703.1 hypothetical protein ELQ16_08700 [Campylobacter sp. US33a]